MGSALTCPTPRVSLSYLLYNIPLYYFRARGRTHNGRCSKLVSGLISNYLSMTPHINLLSLSFNSTDFIIYHPLKKYHTTCRLLPVFSARSSRVCPFFNTISIYICTHQSLLQYSTRHVIPKHGLTDMLPWGVL